ncbi:hypothetical protein C0J52_22312 [Blattella germanica]|nr:hypothetical protein C0J52_22312 [Blattella germanica]
MKANGFLISDDSVKENKRNDEHEGNVKQRMIATEKMQFKIERWIKIVFQSFYLSNTTKKRVVLGSIGHSVSAPNPNYRGSIPSFGAIFIDIMGKLMKTIRNGKTAGDGCLYLCPKASGDVLMNVKQVCGDHCD